MENYEVQSRTDPQARQRVGTAAQRSTRVTVKIPRSFYEQSTLDVARQLLGKYLVRKHPHGTTVGRIVKPEAYVGQEDKACHASGGRPARTEIMFAPAGHVYFYFVSVSHHMLNIVTEQPVFPAAVLI